MRHIKVFFIALFFAAGAGAIAVSQVSSTDAEAAQCQANTPKGARCKNLVSSKCTGNYCHVHCR